MSHGPSTRDSPFLSDFAMFLTSVRISDKQHSFPIVFNIRFAIISLVRNFISISTSKRDVFDGIFLGGVIGAWDQGPSETCHSCHGFGDQSGWGLGGMAHQEMLGISKLELIGGFLSHGGSSSHHPFRTMGFFFPCKPSLLRVCP